jgi:arginyl-tRNA synthetase
MRRFDRTALTLRDKLEQLLRDALRKLETQNGWQGLAAVDPELQRARDIRHGDFSSNVAMRAAPILGIKPRDLAVALVGALSSSKLIARVDVAGPGFINFALAPDAYHEELRAIHARGKDYGAKTPGSGSRILLEYMSANPTGPLHVGHGRHAAYGASLANIMRRAGHTVDEEYYINDAGRQMNILAVSVWLRYAELGGNKLPFPQKCYQGDYVRAIAAELHAAHGKSLRSASPTIAAAAAAAADAEAVLAAARPEAIKAADGVAEERLDGVIAAIHDALGEAKFKVVFAAALDSVLGDIKDDLREFSVVPQRWFSEQSLIDSGGVDAALNVLRERGILYVKDGATWFRSTQFGDDKDRVVIRENGQRTYFASDIAYHLDKCRRGYDLLLNVLGADHHGYVPRLRAVLQAFGESPDRLEIQHIQFVVLYRGETKVQMSTRSGEYVTLRELRNEVGNDAARFFYVSRSNDQHLEFDLELAKTQSSDNPVYYVQYAHARVASMLERMREQGIPSADPASADLGLLTTNEEQSLMRALSRYPEIIELAAANRAPQHVVHYLRELAAEFHQCYNAHRVLVEEPQLRNARVTLALATQQVIANALDLLDVSAPTSM